MQGDWRKNAMLLPVTVAVIVLVLISFFWHANPQAADDQFGNKISESVGFVAAEEAAKVLGDKGGSVTLILPSYGTEEAFRGSQAEPYENGFKKAAAKLPQLHLLGHWAPKPDSASGFGMEALEGAREKFSSADLMVVFLSLPKMKPADEAKWRAVTLPKLVVMENQPWEKGYLRWLELGWVQRVLVANEKREYPETKPSDPHKIFSLFYTIASAP